MMDCGCLDLFSINVTYAKTKQAAGLSNMIELLRTNAKLYTFASYTCSYRFSSINISSYSVFWSRSSRGMVKPGRALTPKVFRFGFGPLLKVIQLSNLVFILVLGSKRSVGREVSDSFTSFERSSSCSCSQQLAFRCCTVVQ
jgi:hypothetical protein